jgi:hypothetical protein
MILFFLPSLTWRVILNAEIEVKAKIIHIQRTLHYTHMAIRGNWGKSQLSIVREFFLPMGFPPYQLPTIKSTNV